LPAAGEVSRWSPVVAAGDEEERDLDADKRWARIISVEGSSHVCIVDDF
jgi:hypothetical protein